jgi:lysophospholipase L1-like esterase
MGSFKRIAAIALILMLSTAAVAQNPPKAPSTPATGRSGSPAGSDLSSMIISRLDAFAKQDAENPPPKDGIVFVGSSIFDQWSNVKQQMAPLPVFNRAISGTTTDQQLKYMDKLTLKYHPKIIVYYCGSNDVGAGSTAADIIENFRKFVDRVAAELPETNVVFASINRAPQKKERWNIVDKANAGIKTYSENNNRVIYAELNTALFDENGNPRLDLYKNDLLHFKPAAYEEFARIIKPILQQLWTKQRDEAESSLKTG